MLNAAISAQGRVGLMLNVEKKNLPAVLSVLPALNSPTVSELSDPAWVALNTILEEGVVRDVVPTPQGRKSNRHCRVSTEQGGSVSDEAHLHIQPQRAGAAGSALRAAQRHL